MRNVRVVITLRAADTSDPPLLPDGFQWFGDAVDELARVGDHRENSRKRARAPSPCPRAHMPELEAYLE
eukprot:gene2121-3210_t